MCYMFAQMNNESKTFVICLHMCTMRVKHVLYVCTCVQWE